MKPRVFISLTGPDGNLGDIFIRRASLDWVRNPDGVVAFVGKHEPSWIQAMGFGERDVLVYGGTARRLGWLVSCALARRRPVLVTDPGETWVGRSRFIHHLIHLVVALLIKARNGVIIIPPHALAQQKAAPMWWPTLRLHLAFARLATICLWREPWSYETAKFGDLVPDIAMSADLRLGDPSRERSLCIISQRGDRAPFSKETLDALTQFARDEHLSIVTVAQVDVDEGRALQLAAQTGGTSFVWDSSNPDSEAELRNLYDNAAVVISDRLHSLIFGLLSGAIPLELAENPERKVAAHLRAIGIVDVSMNTAKRPTSDVSAWLRAQLDRSEELKSIAREAHARLAPYRQLASSSVHPRG